MADFTPRDQKPGTEYLRTRQSDRNTPEIRKAATEADEGPAFGTPGEPPDGDPGSLERITHQQSPSRRQS